MLGYSAVGGFTGTAFLPPPCLTWTQAVHQGANGDALTRVAAAPGSTASTHGSLPSPSSASDCFPHRDRPWERAFLGPKDTVAWPGPHIIAVINVAIGTINNPSAILLTSGSRGQEIPQRLAGPQQSQCPPGQPAPARVPGPSPPNPPFTSHPPGWPWGETVEAAVPRS